MISYTKISFSRTILNLPQSSFDKAEIFQEKTRILNSSGMFRDRIYGIFK